MLIRPDLLFPSRPSAAGKPQPADHTEADTQARSELGQRLHERNRKQQEDMQASLAKLKELQANNSPKKAASQRAALLKQRLETLKSIMAKLPPDDYKVMAQELKQIAKELAALGKQLGRSGSSPAYLPQMMQGASPLAGLDPAVAETDNAMMATSEVASFDEPAILVDAPDSVIAPEPDMPEAVDDAAVLVQFADQAEMPVKDDIPTEADTAQSLLQVTGVGHDSDHADDKQLRALLIEARQVLKQVLAMLKAKHQGNDKESRKTFVDIERKLSKLDQELVRSALSQADGPAGAFDAVESSTGADSIGGFVDVNA